MALDGIQLNNGSGGDKVAADLIAGNQYEVVKQAFGVEGVATMVSETDPLPITDALGSTAAKQDTGNSSLSTIASKDFATQTTLAAVLAKILAAPATEAKQDTGNTSLSTIAGKDFATQTTLAAILAKILTAPSTEAKQDTGNTSLASIDSKLSNPTKMLLSGSTNGKGIKVVQIATAGTLIHTAVSGASSLDKIWVYAYNGHTADVILTIEWGEATVPDGNTIITIPFKQGRVLIEDGRLLQNGLVVRAFASVANVVVIDGEVDRYT